MKDESWNFLSTFLENLAIEVLFSADFDGVVQIFDFCQAISVRKYNLSFCTCLDKYISFLAFSIIFWGFWPIEHLPPIHHNQLGQSFGFACFEGLLRNHDRNVCASAIDASPSKQVRQCVIAATTHEQCCNFGFQKSFIKTPIYINKWQLSCSITRLFSFLEIL